MTTPDPTLDPALKSWVDSANDPATDFPMQNLPFCSFAPKNIEDDEREGMARVGVGIYYFEGPPGAAEKEDA